MTDHSPPARYDSPWKTMLEYAFRDFIAFFFPEHYAEINWSQRLRFLDKELVRVGFGDTPEGRIADKLVSVCLLDGREQWIMIHVEIQAQRDDTLARRVLNYNFRISEHFELPVASLVVLADDDPGWRTNAFHRVALGTEMGISFSTAKLQDYAGQDQILQASTNPFALITLAHLRTQQTRHDAQRRLAYKWQLTKLLYSHRWSKRRIIALFRAINWMMTLPAELNTRFWANIRKLERRRQMEWISPLEESFMEKGRQNGLKQGLAEGMQKGLVKGLEKGIEKGLAQGMEQGGALILERMLTKRFGPLPQTVRRKLAKASVEQLGNWSEAVLQAQSLKQVFS